MQEQLITFETAKLAKEKGFNEECEHYYDLEFKELTSHVEHELFKNSEINKGYGKLNFSMISAPTQSLLQRWLREVHHIHLVCWWYNKENKFYTELGIKGIETIRVQTGNITNLFETYETALEAGLQEALKLIK